MYKIPTDHLQPFMFTTLDGQIGKIKNVGSIPVTVLEKIVKTSEHGDFLYTIAAISENKQTEEMLKSLTLNQLSQLIKNWQEHGTTAGADSDGDIKKLSMSQFPHSDNTDVRLQQTYCG